jgi:hypothetical protein
VRGRYLATHRAPAYRHDPCCMSSTLQLEPGVAVAASASGPKLLQNRRARIGHLPIPRAGGRIPGVGPATRRRVLISATGTGSAYNQMTAGLGVEVVEELIAARSEGADIDRHLLTGRHYLLTVQLIAFELRRGGTLVRDV